MVYDLRSFGFTGCVISEDLRDISNNLPKWGAIPQTKIRVPSVQLNEHFTKPIRDISGRMILPVYEWGKQIDEGTYGKIYIADRKLYIPIPGDISGVVKFQPNTIVDKIVIKESFLTLTPQEEKMPHETKLDIIEEEIDAHIHEAAVHTLAYIAVCEAGIPHAVPKVYEIFSHGKTPYRNITDMTSICISMEYIHGLTLQRYLESNFMSNDLKHNDSIFLDFLKQMAKILSVLQTKLRMNHRDIKINNVLVRDINGSPTLVLIDYGFACIANGKQEPDAEFSKIEAGSYFGSRYACFKHGRDLLQYLYSVHCYFPYKKYLSVDLVSMIEGLMTVKYKYGYANLLNGLSPQGHHNIAPNKLVFDEGIYLFLRRPEVDPIHCSPQKILEDIVNFERRKLIGAPAP
jgi:serine/threonine protein kinase